MFQLVIDENRMVVTQRMTLIETFFVGTLCITFILKLNPLFIYNFIIYILCICRFKNDLFPCGSKLQNKEEKTFVSFFGKQSVKMDRNKVTDKISYLRYKMTINIRTFVYGRSGGSRI